MTSPKPGLVRRGVLWLAELSRSMPDLFVSKIPAEFGQVQSHQLPQLLATVEQMDPIPSEALLRRFALGRRCYTAVVNHSIAAYGWLTQGPEWVGEFERQLNVQPGEAYIWDCATLPIFRRQRLFTALLSYVVRELSHEGLQRLWIIAVITTPVMNRSVAAAGFEPILNLSFLHLPHTRVLLTVPVSSASPRNIAASRQLVKGDGEYAFGPMIIGQSGHPRLPDTHIDPAAQDVDTIIQPEAVKHKGITSRVTRHTQHVD